MLFVRSATVLAGAAAALSAPPALAELPLTRVAETGVEGSLGPGLGAGVTYLHFGVPVVDASGNIVFFAELAGNGITTNNNTTIVAGPPTGQHPQIREGDPSPVNGQPLLQLANNPNAGAGDVLTTDLLDYVVRENGSLSALIRIGSQAAGAPAGVLYNSVARTLASDIGLYGFIATLTGVVTSADNAAVFFGPPGALQLISRKGDAAPGTSGDTFGDFTSLGVAPDGLMALHALLADGGEATWMGDESGFSLVVRDGSPAPGMPPGSIFAAFDQAPSIASGGAVAFKGFAIGPVNGNENEGVWIGLPGALTLVLREGSTNPALPAGVRIDGHYIDTNTPQINDAGEFAYRARLTGTGVTPDNDRAIFAGSPAAPTLVAREGDTAPGAGGAYFSSLLEPTINQRGDVAFEAVIDGPGVSGDNDLAIFVWNEATGLHLVARDGDVVTFGLGDDRTIVYLEFFGGVRGSSGLATGLGDNGVIAFRAGVLPNGDVILSARTPGSEPADFNGDGAVDGVDLAYFLAFWGPCSGACEADFNGDDIVDGVDLAYLLAAWTG